MSDFPLVFILKRKETVGLYITGNGAKGHEVVCVHFYPIK